MSAGFHFPAQHEKAHVTKDLTSASGLGQRESGREGKQEEGALLHFKSSNSKVGFFWREFTKFQLQSRQVLTAFRPRPLFRSAHGYRTRREGEWKETQPVIGQLHWAIAAMLLLDEIMHLFFFWRGVFSLCVSNMAANAPRALSSTLLNSERTGESFLLYCSEIQASYLPENDRVSVARTPTTQNPPMEK